jgi:hypothetical protein
LVIKLSGTDIADFPDDLLLDFYLKDKDIDLFKDIKNFLRKRSHHSHKNRKVLLAKDINKINIDRIKDLFKHAHQLRAK